MLIAVTEKVLKGDAIEEMLSRGEINERKLAVGILKRGRAV